MNKVESNLQASKEHYESELKKMERKLEVRIFKKSIKFAACLKNYLCIKESQRELERIKKLPKQQEDSIEVLKRLLQSRCSLFDYILLCRFSNTSCGLRKAILWGAERQ